MSSGTELLDPRLPSRQLTIVVNKIPAIPNREKCVHASAALRLIIIKSVPPKTRAVSASPTPPMRLGAPMVSGRRCVPLPGSPEPGREPGHRLPVRTRRFSERASELCVNDLHALRRIAEESSGRDFQLEGLPDRRSTEGAANRNLR